MRKSIAVVAVTVALAGGVFIGGQTAMLSQASGNACSAGNQVQTCANVSNMTASVSTDTWREQEAARQLAAQQEAERIQAEQEEAARQQAAQTTVNHRNSTCGYCGRDNSVCGGTCRNQSSGTSNRDSYHRSGGWHHSEGSSHHGGRHH